MWRGRADLSRPQAYPEHFRRNVLPELQAIDGFRGATLLRHDSPNGIEFVVLTRWASMEAIHAFAGTDAEKAVVEPEAVAALASYDRTVRHYEVLDESGSA